MKKQNLDSLANALLSQNGYAYDGSKLKSLSKKQRSFEKNTIIKTPMGNRR